MSALRHGPPLAMNGYMDKEGRKFRARKTRYFKLKDSALFNHRRKDSVRSLLFLLFLYTIATLLQFRCVVYLRVHLFICTTSFFFDQCKYSDLEFLIFFICVVYRRCYHLST